MRMDRYDGRRSPARALALVILLAGTTWARQDAALAAKGQKTQQAATPVLNTGGLYS